MPGTLGRQVTKRSRVWVGLVLGLTLTCSRTSRDTGLAEHDPPGPRVPDTAASGSEKRLAPAQFHVAEVDSTVGFRRFLATTDDPGPSCAFEIAQEPSASIDGAPFLLGKLALCRRPRSDCTEFLRRVAKQVGFSGPLPHPPPTDAISCSIVILGISQSRAEDAEVGPTFFSKPSGNWMAGKLFVADGEGEVFLNLNLHDRVGEFSMKDEDYAAIVVRELARILLPQAA
jgi:hypothetical protein